jgi:hypothetical protein
VLGLTCPTGATKEQVASGMNVVTQTFMCDLDLGFIKTKPSSPMELKGKWFCMNAAILKYKK